jgi:uncharacterized protein (TIGR03435 family)
MRTALLLAFSGFLSYGQIAAKLEFEVASIKPSVAPSGGRGMNVGMQGGPGTTDPTQITYSNMTLKLLIMTAYNMKTYQVTAPDWTNEGQRFNIAAKVPEGASKEDLRAMLQNLLAVRFQTKAHLDKKEMQAFALVVAKGGVKMKVSEEKPPDPNGAAGPPTPGPPKFDKDGFPIVSGNGMILETQNGRSRLAAKQASIAQICNFLGIQYARPVIDQTGLTGKYDYHLEFAPENAPPPDAGSPATSGDPAPTLLMAIQDQLGLKLEAKKLPVDIVVVDHIERTPTEN